MDDGTSFLDCTHERLVIEILTFDGYVCTDRLDVNLSHGNVYRFHAGTRADRFRDIDDRWFGYRLVNIQYQSPDIHGVLQKGKVL
jgi:hypothetical protein